MSDDRALTWANLFPSSASFTAIGSRSRFRELVEARRNGEKASVLIAENCQSLAHFDLRQFAGMVAVNCPQLTPHVIRDAGFPYLRRFAVLPSLDNARWFVPLDTPAISAAAFRLYTPYRTLARLRHLGVRAVARGGLPIWYRDEVLIAERMRPPIERMLSTLFPREAFRLALSAGTPGPARKPTAAVLSLDGQVWGFAKFAETAASNRLVQHEAEVLRRLARQNGQAHIAPPLLYAGNVDQLYVTVQGVLPGRAAPRALTSAHRRFLARLQSGPPRPAAKSPIVTSLRQRVVALPSRRADLMALHDAILPQIDRVTLPSTIVHGDFAPWNLRVSHDGVAAFDWEYAELDGLPLLDEIHHMLQTGFLLEDWSVERAYYRLLALAAERPLGLQFNEVHALQSVYLLEALLRRVEEGHPTGDPTSVRYEHLLSLLTPDVRSEAAA